MTFVSTTALTMTSTYLPNGLVYRFLDGGCRDALGACPGFLDDSPTLIEDPLPLCFGEFRRRNDPRDNATVEHQFNRFADLTDPPDEFANSPLRRGKINALRHKHPIPLGK